MSDGDSQSDLAGNEIGPNEINRRSILQRTAGAASAIGIGSTLGTESVTASQINCTNYRNVNKFKDWVWRYAFSTAAEYTCPDADLPPFSRVEHAASLVYEGTYEENEIYDHLFFASAHAEGYENKHVVQTGKVEVR